MRRLFAGILVAVVCLTGSLAGAEGIDISGYSYEELMALREAIDLRIEEMERAEAIANADRRIFFENEEVTIYLRGTVSQRAEVERLTEEAPWRTDFIWSSSNPEAARVDETGLVTAAGAGTAVITATTTDNKYLCASYTVYVAIPVETVTLWGPGEPMAIIDPENGAMQVLGYSIEPEDATCQDITWSSSDETIAVVDENGIVHGIRPGKAVISAVSAEDPPANRVPVQASYEVTVLQLVTGIELNESEIALNVGQTFRLEAATVPEDASNSTVSYESRNPEIAAVDARGTVTATAPGECEILCTAADGSGTETVCRVKVSKLITGITLAEKEIRLPAGGTCAIETEIMPEDATNKELIWTSSNVFVARAANGIIEAVGQGECEITCTAADGSGVSATIQVRVPTFSTPESEYTVSEKSGITIPLQTGRKGTQVDIQYDTDCFTAERNEAGEIVILPVNAGEGKIILTNPEEEKDRTELLITVENSAVFNQYSYPMVPYDQLVQTPDRYAGRQVSLYGRVLQKSLDEEGNTLLTIGTAGEDYSDQVFQVRMSKETIGEEPEEDALATFYGIFRNEKIHSEALGSDITLPGLECEKVVKEE